MHQVVEHAVHDGHDEQREQRRRDQAADHGPCHWCALFGTFTNREGQRQHTENHRDRGHDDRPQADAPGTEQRLGAFHAALTLLVGEVINATAIYIGAVAEDSSGYPDCRPEFYAAFQNVLDLGTRPETHITIKTPVIAMRKSEIVRKGLDLGAPLHLTWSCYQESDAACGKCDSCALRLRAFREAGASDPIPYMLDSSRFAY